MLNNAYTKIQSEIEAVRNGTSNTKPQEIAKETSRLFADGSINEVHFFDIMDKLGALVR